MNGERQRLRPWLESQIDGGRVPQLIWLDKSQGIFKVPWKHAGKPGFNLERDAVLFREWARHTGKYKDGEQPDASTWKTRFRCAINKLPDIEEIKHKSNLDGDDPYRVFQFLPRGSVKSPPGSTIEIKCEVDDASMLADPLLDVDEMQQKILDGFELPDGDEDYFTCSPETSEPMMADISPFIAEEEQPIPLPVNPMPDVNDIIGMNPDAMKLGIKIYYHENLMKEMVVNNSLGCRIFSGADFTPLEQFRHVYGPREVDQIQLPFLDSPIMETLSRGLLLQCENNSIFATRFCRTHVYASGGCLGPSTRPLTRGQPTRVFDYDKFLAGLAEYRLTKAPLPLYEVFFTFGQQPATSSTVDPGVLITISVTHLTAKASISKMGNGSDVFMSLEDEGDRLAKQIQQMALQSPGACPH